VALTAATLPGLEMLAGSFLVAGHGLAAWSRLMFILGRESRAGAAGGVLRRASLLGLILLLVVFLIILLVTLARGLKIDCGCGLFASRPVSWMAILEDGVLLLLAMLLYGWELLQAGAAETQVP
jgi:hypothetical protein